MGPASRGFFVPFNRTDAMDSALALPRILRKRHLDLA